MKNILITGGAGFIGSNLALHLKKEGHKITILDNLSPQIHGDCPEQNSPLFQSIIGAVEIIIGDICNKKDWEKAIAGQDLIIHLAAETGTGQSMYEISKYVNTNILGISYLLETLINTSHKVEKIILASTRAVYGEGKYLHPSQGFIYPIQRNAKDMFKGKFDFVDENDELLEAVATDEQSILHPSSIYGITKLNQEQMVQSISAGLGIATSILRFQNVYGEGQSLKNPYTGILSIFSTQILNGENVNIFEDGKESRDFIHVDDACEALRLCIENEVSHGKIYNVGSGTSRSVEEVAAILIKYYKKNVEAVVSGQFRIGDIRHNFADITKIKRELNFEPRIAFDEGMKRFTDWVITRNPGLINYEKSLSEMNAKGFLQ